MSLLMDALRRAEEAKRKAGAGSRPGASVSPDELRLDPLDTSPRPAEDSPARSFAERFDTVEADPEPGSASAPADRRPPTRPARPPEGNETREAAERSAARNVFAVKQAPRSRTSLWLVLGLLTVATIGIGGYFWWQLQSIAGGSMSVPATAAGPALDPTAQRLPPPASVPPPATAAVSPEAVAAPTEEAQQPAPAPARAESSSAARHTPGEAARRPAAAAQSVFQRSNGRRQEAQTLSRAYGAWQAGRLDEARLAYEQVLRGDAKNADALLGLAAIAGRQGQAERAHALYLRVLESDPTDVTAQAALINLRGQNDAGQSESRLKTLIGKQPDSPALYFALGNLYAGQARWSEAQQAYFQAYALAPANADYVFNVAVSLDHLRQKKLAAQYYGMALSAAENAPVAFDKDAAEKRILELQP
ncbi:tetratricopeptide repeat protein [Accumulibacter sp.]|uniref:tetratricopeptide repeat protein n=1 Tax=Accumulibacter sp. TaxID=2053492 RepID=UPI0025F156D1|nr:tetratricopeptide repeat protein [Accumulibacter sp.]MCP5227736.1 tetratricopeptide repeat protein [Accumulibacter sp.]